jgi:hypothetical protein
MALCRQLIGRGESDHYKLRVWVKGTAMSPAWPLFIRLRQSRSARGIASPCQNSKSISLIRSPRRRGPAAMAGWDAEWARRFEVDGQLDLIHMLDLKLVRLSPLGILSM